LMSVAELMSMCMLETNSDLELELRDNGPKYQVTNLKPGYRVDIRMNNGR